MSALNLADRVERIRMTVLLADAQRQKAKASLAEAKRQTKVSKRKVKDLKKAVLVIEYLIAKKYDKVIESFEGTVTAALMDLFDKYYEFKFALGKRGDHTTCDLTVNTGRYKGFLDLRMTQGTALKEIIGAIIRIVIIKLDKDMPDCIILDEPFSKLKSYKQALAGAFLKKVCKNFGLQLVLITQADVLAQCADKMINLGEAS